MNTQEMMNEALDLALEDVRCAKDDSSEVELWYYGRMRYESWLLYIKTHPPLSINS